MVRTSARSRGFQDGFRSPGTQKRVVAITYGIMAAEDISDRSMMAWIKANIFNLIAVAVLACFAGVWIYIMKQVVDFQPSDEEPVLKLATGVVTLAGLLATTIATITASALGFTVAEVKAQAGTDSSIKLNAATVGSNLTTPTTLAVIVYVLVSVGVFFTWIANEEISPEVLSVFALSSIGWLVGSASVAFKTTAD